MTNARRKRIRLELLLTFGQHCWYCGGLDPGTEWNGWTLDHIVPLSKGGPSTDLNNIVLACRPCNKRKADTIYT
jgi:5-methylcytosine-specific restriction endonuclease McrA